jgi:hypothetical protein
VTIIEVEIEGEGAEDLARAFWLAFAKLAAQLVDEDVARSDASGHQEDAA